MTTFCAQQRHRLQENEYAIVLEGKASYLFSANNLVMKLVYLDTSHLDLLAKELTSDIQNFYRFVDRWHASEYVLAISKIHLEEVMVSRYPESIGDRFDVLSALLPLRYESVNFFEREIYAALTSRGFIENGAVGIGTKFFSSAVETDDTLREIERSLFAVRKLGIYRMISTANRASWRANKSEKKTRPVHGIGQRHGLLQSMFIKAYFAFVRLFGTERQHGRNLGKSIERTLEDFELRVKVRFTMQNRLGVSVLDKRHDSNVVSKLSLTECKGLWLRKQVEKRLKRAGDFDPSNENDLNHVQYYPYVDLFLSDKRIVDKIEQVIRSEVDIQWIQVLERPLKVANHLESLEMALFGIRDSPESL